MISAIVMEISLLVKITWKIRILPFSHPMSGKKNKIFLVFISLGRVHNQYLKYIEIRNLVDEHIYTYHLKTGSSVNHAATSRVSP